MSHGTGDRRANGAILLATRGSALALAQAESVLAQCRAAFPTETFELKIIKTTGDKLQTASLAGGALPQGLFTKELETALLQGEADLAVHSLKDLPTDLPAGLALAATPPRADVREVLIYRDIEHLARHPALAPSTGAAPRGFKPHLTLAALPHGATLATSSTRRAAQALAQRPDLCIVPIRGNVGTRLRKLAEQREIDVTLLAAAGLLRLGCRIAPDGRLEGNDVPDGLAANHLSQNDFLPCVGQGAIGLEIRDNDARARHICTALNHTETFQCVIAERAFLHAMGGGCQAAIGACAVACQAEIFLRATSLMGGVTRRAELAGRRDEAGALGERLAAQLRQ